MTSGKSLTIRHLDVTVDSKNFIPGATKILNLLRPEWEELDIKPLCGGFLNLMLTCRQVSDTENKDAVVIRVFNQAMDGAMNRDREIAVMALLSDVGVGPPFYGVFNNGLIMKFLTGRTLKWTELWQDDIIQITTAQMARLHSIEVANCHISDDSGKVYNFDMQKTFLMALKDMAKTIPDKLTDPVKNQRFQTELPTRQQLMKDVDDMEQWLFKQNLPLVLSHNDLYTNNIIYDELSGSMYFIDFETCGLNCAAFDFGIMFFDVSLYVEFSKGLDGPPVCTPDDKDADDAVFRKWARHYLEAKKELSKTENVITEADVANFAHQMEQFKACTGIFGAVFMGAMLDGDVSIEIVAEGYKAYTARKHLLV